MPPRATRSRPASRRTTGSARGAARALLLLAALLTWHSGSAFAQGGSPGATPLTLAHALELGPDASADVLGARSALAAAQRDEKRVASDPGSLRVDRLSASDAVTQAQADLDAALAANATAVAGAFFDALEADTAVSNANLDLDIQRQTLTAEQARRDAGASTDLDVAKAQNAVSAAHATAADAEAQRTLAFATLSSLLGTAVDALEPVQDTPDLGPVDSYLERARQANRQLVSARAAVALAQAKYDASNNDFTARSAIENAKDAVTDAQRTLQESQRTLELSVRNAYATAVAAQAAMANAGASDATAAKDLDAAKARLDAGAIAPLTYRSSELTRSNAAQGLESARHTYLLRRYQLDQAVVGG